MPQIQADNAYRPRSKKKRDAIRKRKAAERAGKAARASLSSSVNQLPNYEIPADRNSHLNIPSAPLSPPVETDKKNTNLSPEMLEREKAAQAEIERKKKCIAPAYNKGAYQYVGSEEQAKWVGK